MKPVNPSVATPNQAIIDEFVAYKKSTKGLTPRGEQWLQDMTGRFPRQLRMNLTDVGPEPIVEFLGPYSAALSKDTVSTALSRASIDA